jgi:hypothetical protein
MIATIGMKLGWQDTLAANFGQALGVRRAALGEDGQGDPRFLVRVDEFPSAGSSYAPLQYGIEIFRRFHEILAVAHCPYLLAVVPELAQEYFDPSSSAARDLSEEEVELLQTISVDGVEFAQHGTTHRSRHRSSRRRSELSGLSPDELGGVIDRGAAKLSEIGIRPRIFVPPFNRFDAPHWALLAERFDVITGGPESVPIIGPQPGPAWRGDAVYAPCYPPLYGHAAGMLSAVERIIDLQPGCWVPIVLHTSWEADDGFESLEKLVAKVAPKAASWTEFLSAVDRSGAAAV